MDFSINSKFYSIMSKIADCMILSLLWLLFSLPLITAGTASTALYYCVIKVVRKGEGSACKNFWHAFRDNLKQTVLITLLFVGVCAGCAAAGSWIASVWQSQKVLDNLYTVYMGILIFLAGWMHYIFSYIARFRDSLKTTLKNTVLIGLVNIPSSVGMVFLLAAVVFVLVMTFPASGMFLLIVPAGYAWVTSFLLERIYRRYQKTESPVTGA